MSTITDVTSILNSYSTTSTTDTSSSSSTADSLTDDFLTLLTAQIEYQDPLDPMESSEYTSQLAALTTVQELSDIETQLEYQQLYLASINNSMVTNFIGKEVVASGDTITYDGSTSPTLSYTLDDAATSVVINVYDSDGSVVRTISCGSQDAGQQEITWDGYDSDGNAADTGTYTFEVLATDADGNSVTATTEISGTVDSIFFEEGVGYVTVNGQDITISDIIEIKNGTE